MRAVLFCFLFIACTATQLHAATTVVVDSNGNITGALDFGGFNWQPEPGFTAVAQTFPPMLVGGKLINGVYAPPPAPAAPSPTSVAVVSKSTAAALSGTYAFDATTQSKILAVSLYIQVNGKFPAGQMPFPWPDASGTMHSFASTSQF